MKRIVKSAAIIVVVLSLLLVSTIAVAAASFPYNSLRRLNTTTSYQTICSESTSSRTGINRNVFIQNNNTSVARSDVRMLGKNGNVVWEGRGALAIAEGRVFWCGSGVYTVQIRTQSGRGTAYAQPR